MVHNMLATALPQFSQYEVIQSSLSTSRGGCSYCPYGMGADTGTEGLNNSLKVTQCHDFNRANQSQ